MINCPNCNHQNPDGALQCEACYTPLPALANCPNCNASIQADASFCGQCGSDLREETLTANTGPASSTEAAAPTQAVFPQTPEIENEAEPDSEIKTQNFLVPPGNSSAPEAGIPDLVVPDPLVIPEPVGSPAPIGNEESAAIASYAGTELSSETEPSAEAAPDPSMAVESESLAEPNLAEPNLAEPNIVEPAIELAAEAEPEPVVETPEPVMETEATPFIETATAPMPTPAPAISQSPATQLQLTTARLKQVQTNTIIELPRGLSLVRIGKPNDHTPPDIDVSGFPDSEIVSRVHANIRIEGDTYFLEDVGSSNGTYINGLPLPVGNRHRLRPSDRIAFGKGDKVSFIFEISS